MSHDANPLDDAQLDALIHWLNLPTVRQPERPPHFVEADPDWRADLWLLSQQLERGC